MNRHSKHGGRFQTVMSSARQCCVASRPIVARVERSGTAFESSRTARVLAAGKHNRLTGSPCAEPSPQHKIKLDGHDHWYWLTETRAGKEAPFFGGLDRLLVEAE